MGHYYDCPRCGHERCICSGKRERLNIYSRSDLKNNPVGEISFPESIPAQPYGDIFKVVGGMKVGDIFTVSAVADTTQSASRRIADLEDALRPFAEVGKGLVPRAAGGWHRVSEDGRKDIVSGVEFEEYDDFVHAHDILESKTPVVPDSVTVDVVADYQTLKRDYEIVIAALRKTYAITVTSASHASQKPVERIREITTEALTAIGEIRTPSS